MPLNCGVTFAYYRHVQLETCKTDIHRTSMITQWLMPENQKWHTFSKSAKIKIYFYLYKFYMSQIFYFINSPIHDNILHSLCHNGMFYTETDSFIHPGFGHHPCKEMSHANSVEQCEESKSKQLQQKLLLCALRTFVLYVINGQTYAYCCVYPL